MNAISTLVRSSRVNVFKVQGVLFRRKSVHAVLSRYLRCGEVVLEARRIGKAQTASPVLGIPD